jgi:hypothetical protein
LNLWQYAKENDVIPDSFESWVFLLAACFIGFVIGQWMKNRRDKGSSPTNPTIHSEIYQEKRLSKKARRKRQRLSK